MSRVAVALTLLAVGLVSGCDGEHKVEPPKAAPQVCAAQASAAPLPDGFPTALPLPAGAVVTASEQRSGGRVVVSAVTAGDFRSTLAFFQSELPKAGFRLTDGEVESRDAESDFESAGWKGRWALREIPDCHGGVSITVVTQAR